MKRYGQRLGLTVCAVVALALSPLAVAKEQDPHTAINIDQHNTSIKTDQHIDVDKHSQPDKQRDTKRFPDFDRHHYQVAMDPSLRDRDCRHDDDHGHDNNHGQIHGLFPALGNIFGTGNIFGIGHISRINDGDGDWDRHHHECKPRCVSPSRKHHGCRDD